MRPDIGTRVEIFWPDDNQYYAGAVTEIRNDGKWVIVYDDDEKEVLNMSRESWRFEPSSRHGTANSVNKTLQSNEQSLIRSMMDQLGQRPFLWHHTQGF